jgi:DNA-binding CsgD family transcriptional regulator
VAISSSCALLNERERQVLHLLCEGRSNKLIARRLAIAEATVKYHLSNLYSKLGVRTRGLAVAIAREHGIASAQDSPQKAATSQ